MSNSGLCQCGCGEPAPLATQNNAASGYVKGQPFRFIRGHHTRGERSKTWNGGRTMSRGYVLVLVPDHPRCNRDGYVMEHLLVAARALGRPLPDDVEVHHVNEGKADNRNQNLVICQDHAYHMLLHRRAKAYRATGNPNSRKCVYCKRWGLDLSINKSGGAAYHAACVNKYNQTRYAARKEAR